MIRITTAFIFTAFVAVSLLVPAPAGAYNQSLCMGYAGQYGMVPDHKFCQQYHDAQSVSGVGLSNACNEAKRSIKTHIENAFSNAMDTCRFTPQAANACIQGVQQEHQRSLEANDFGFSQCLKRKFFQ